MTAPLSELQADLLAAIIEHDAKGKFEVFMQDERLRRWRSGLLTESEYRAYASEHVKRLEANVTAYCTCKRIYEKHFGTLPDVSKYVKSILETYKKGYGWTK